jgi:hypothetical protein
MRAFVMPKLAKVGWLTPRSFWPTPPALPLFLLWAVIALAYRLPAVLYTDLNWDEALYRLIGGSLVSGHAPYTEFWDRKPVGIFLITAAVQIVFGKSLLALRLTTSIVVALSAFLLALNAQRIIPTLPQIGAIAGLFFLLYSTHDGGEGTNTELFYISAGLAGLFFALKAAGSAGMKSSGLGLAGGLLMGSAVEIKETAVFDILAYAMLYLVTQVKELSPSHLLHHARIAVAAAIGILLPTALVILWYALIGQLGRFYDANFAANIGLLGDGAPEFYIPDLILGFHGLDVLFIGTAITLAAGPFLAKTRELQRGLLAISCWLVAMSMSLIFSRRFADHFFLQVIPALALATAFGIVLAVRTWVPVHLASAGILLCVGLISVLAATPQFSAAAEVLWQRYIKGIPYWGDKTATIAAAIRGRVQGPHDVYVFSRWLGVYQITDTIPPTRFPFALHLFSGYAPVDGTAEIKRILANSPRFMVIDDNWLKEIPASYGRAAGPFDELHRSLSRNYAIDGHVGAFKSWGGGTVGTKVGATVFRLAGMPGIRSTPAFQYDLPP